MIVTAKLWIVPGERDAFDTFESRAFERMQAHGASVLSVTRPETGPDEIHVIDFPSAEAFANYRNDPEMAQLKELRARAIAKTEVSTA